MYVCVCVLCCACCVLCVSCLCVVVVCAFVPGRLGDELLHAGLLQNSPLYAVVVPTVHAGHTLAKVLQAAAIHHASH